MAARTVMLTLSEELYRQLQVEAQTVAVSVEEVIVQTLADMLQPAEDEEVSPGLEAALKAMTRLSDEELWQIAHGSVEHGKVALYDALLARQLAGTITPQGQTQLDRLREDAEELMLRKAHAYALLQSRGHRLSPLQELHAKIHNRTLAS